MAHAFPGHWIVDVKSTESDAHFIGYFTGLSIEMLRYCVLIY